MAVQTTGYDCLCCGGHFLTNKHTCARECRVEGEKVLHFDFCTSCRGIIIANCEEQMRRKELPSRLRIE